MSIDRTVSCWRSVNAAASIFVSFAQTDAKEKILIARQVYSEIPAQYQKKLVTDSKTELAFESSGAKKGISRILSVPSKPPRGKTGDVLLDELAHYINDREVYTGSTPLISRIRGQMTGCSTPLGKRGIFWEIASQEGRKYPTHSRQVVPWWLSRFFCTDVARAAREAPEMSTLERVKTFGNSELLQQYDSLVETDFRQEFEVDFQDQTYSYYPYEEIVPNTVEDLVLYHDFRALPVPTGRIVAGFDVGRARDRSELAVFEEQSGKFICRMLKHYIQVPFAEQEADLRLLLNTVPVARLSIDKSGIGMQMTENLCRGYPQVVGENFTNESKERWATDFKILLQHGHVVLPRERGVIGQIHSIKRVVTPSGKVAFDSERTGQGHADQFWAIVLACQKEREKPKYRGAIITARVLG